MWIKRRKPMYCSVWHCCSLFPLNLICYTSAMSQNHQAISIKVLATKRANSVSIRKMLQCGEGVQLKRSIYWFVTKSPSYSSSSFTILQSYTILYTVFSHIFCYCSKMKHIKQYSKYVNKTHLYKKGILVNIYLLMNSKFEKL